MLSENKNYAQMEQFNRCLMYGGDILEGDYNSRGDAHDCFVVLY